MLSGRGDGLRLGVLPQGTQSQTAQSIIDEEQSQEI